MFENLLFTIFLVLSVIIALLNIAFAGVNFFLYRYSKANQHNASSDQIVHIKNLLKVRLILTILIVVSTGLLIFFAWRIKHNP